MKLLGRIAALVLVFTAAAAFFCSCSYVDGLTDAYTQMFETLDKQRSGPETSVYEVDGGGEDEFDALLALFRENGYSPEWEDAEPIFLSGARRTISLGGGKTVNAFIYPTGEDARTESSHFSADGAKYDSASVGIDINWAAEPHLYLYGRMIVLYVGEDAGLIAQLGDMLGEQFAGA